MQWLAAATKYIYVLQKALHCGEMRGNSRKEWTLFWHANNVIQRNDICLRSRAAISSHREYLYLNFSLSTPTRIQLLYELGLSFHSGSVTP